MKRYKISAPSCYLQLAPQTFINEEAQAVKNFCSNSTLFNEMERLANACKSDFARNTNMIHSIKNADSFVIAIDILEQELSQVKSDPPFVQTLRAGFLFFASAVLNEASYERGISDLCDELKIYAVNNGFEIKSEDSVYCQPNTMELNS